MSLLLRKTRERSNFVYYKNVIPESTQCLIVSDISSNTENSNNKLNIKIS